MTVAKAGFSVAAGKSALVKLKLAQPFRALLERSDTARVLVVAVVRDATGNTATFERRLTLMSPKAAAGRPRE